MSEDVGLFVIFLVLLGIYLGLSAWTEMGTKMPWKNKSRDR